MEQFSEKQIHIMNIATDLFAEHGFTRTSVRDIAVAAEVNVAMISYYFGSKEQLLEAIFDLHLAKKEDEVDAIVERKDISPKQKIEHIIDHFVASIYNNIAFNKIQVRQTTIELDQNSPIFQKIMAFRTKSREMFDKIIKEGQNEGTFKKGIDLILLSAFFVGTVNQAITNKPYYSAVYKIPEDDDALYQKKFVSKLIKELKTIIIAYLTYDVQS